MEEEADRLENIDNRVVETPVEIVYEDDYCLQVFEAIDESLELISELRD